MLETFKLPNTVNPPASSVLPTTRVPARILANVAADRVRVPVPPLRPMDLASFGWIITVPLPANTGPLMLTLLTVMEIWALDEAVIAVPVVTLPLPSVNSETPLNPIAAWLRVIAPFAPVVARLNIPPATIELAVMAPLAVTCIRYRMKELTKHCRKLNQPTDWDHLCWSWLD